ncbi:hypothetical protein ACIOC1_19440 [Streptomyces sp. NPDC088197]|uniref:hypothetical protein n=1 Tax=Streptomyces sp. NPDC088197 TaxID=3365840 RepID=UPI0037F423B0
MPAQIRTQDTRDPRRDTPPPNVGALLAAGAAARTLSTPPDDGEEPAPADAPVTTATGRTTDAPEAETGA